MALKVLEQAVQKQYQCRLLCTILGAMFVAVAITANLPATLVVDTMAYVSPPVVTNSAEFQAAKAAGVRLVTLVPSTTPKPLRNNIKRQYRGEPRESAKYINTWYTITVRNADYKKKKKRSSKHRQLILQAPYRGPSHREAPLFHHTWRWITRQTNKHIYKEGERLFGSILPNCYKRKMCLDTTRWELPRIVIPWLIVLLVSAGFGWAILDALWGMWSPRTSYLYYKTCSPWATRLRCSAEQLDDEITEEVREGDQPTLDVPALNAVVTTSWVLVRDSFSGVKLMHLRFVEDIERRATEIRHLTNGVYTHSTFEHWLELRTSISGFSFKVKADNGPVLDKLHGYLFARICIQNPYFFFRQFFRRAPTDSDNDDSDMEDECTPNAGNTPTVAEAYEELGVDSSADFSTVRKAYKVRALKVHPDRNSDAAATEKFQRLQACYEVLVAEYGVQ